MNAKPFFSYARERYRIYLKKEAGDPKPWTKDPMLQQYRFCNIFREDDKVTKWFRESGARSTTFSCVAFRLINRIETAERMLRLNLFQRWNPAKMLQEFRGVKPLISGAYIVHTPFGLKKLEGIIEILNPVWKAQQAGKLDFGARCTLEAAHHEIMKFNFIGSFIAYEAVTDLNYTSVLERAPDKNLWAAAGPGAARGLAKILDLPPKHWSHGNAKHREEMLHYMQKLLKYSRNPTYWPAEWPEWDMRTVEHTLCEHFKYGRGHCKQRYEGKE